MFCLENKNLAFVKVPKEQVVKSCNQTLNSIYSKRSNCRKKFIQRYLSSNWAKFRKFIGFPLTKRHAIYAYYHDGTFPEHYDVMFLYGHQEQKCKELLRLAESSENYMFISSDGASACNLG